MRIYLHLQIFACFIVESTISWEYYTPLNAVKMSKNTAYTKQKVVTSEYNFGKCPKDLNDLEFYIHITVNARKILGRLIYRAYLGELHRIPTCVVLKSRSAQQYLDFYARYNFQLCIPRLSFTHGGFRFKFFYMEWFLPSNMTSGADWDFYFYGPQREGDTSRW